MVKKPWYVKKPAQNFVRQKNHRLSPFIPEPTRSPLSVKKTWIDHKKIGGRSTPIDIGHDLIFFFVLPASLCLASTAEHQFSAPAHVPWVHRE
jgi:hypothetical protein